MTAALPFRLPVAPAEMELVAKYFRALGAPTRLEVLELLAEEGELSVGDLMERMGIPQPQLSNHLACLRWCGFVTNRRDFRTVYYSVADERVSALVTLARSLLRDNADHVASCSTIDRETA
jgi:DNA-binding transcriptional ArsR family regulator